MGYGNQKAKRIEWRIGNGNRRGKIAGVLFLLLPISHSLLPELPGQGPVPMGTQEMPSLTEVEVLKGENLQLKYDSIDKQMRLMQEQFLRLAEQQRQLIADLQTLEAAALKERGLKPEEWRVNWQARQIEKQPQSPRDTEQSEENKAE